MNTQWQHYNFTLTTDANAQPTKEARFVITATRQGSYWFNLISHSRTDARKGIEKDLHQDNATLVDHRPANGSLPY